MKLLIFILSLLFSFSIHAQMKDSKQYQYAAAFVIEGGTAKTVFGNELSPLWRVYLCLENSADPKEMNVTLRTAELGGLFQTWVGNSDSGIKKYYQLREMKFSFPYSSHLVEAGDYLYPEMKFEINSTDIWDQIAGSPQETYPSDSSIIQYAWDDHSITSWGTRYFENQDKSVGYVSYGIQKTAKTPESGLVTTPCEGQNQAVLIEKSGE